MTLPRPAAVAAALALALAPLAAAGAAEAGTAVDNLELKTIAGGKEKLFTGKAKANVIIFFRTGQERSADALRQAAACEKELAAKAVRWIGVVSDTEPLDAVKALVAQAGIAMPVLVDQGDVLYGKLGIRLHPMVVLVDGRQKVSAVEMYRQIDWCEIIKGRIQVLLGEIDDAAMRKILNPDKGTMPGDDIRDIAKRDVNLGRRQLKIGKYDHAMQNARRALEKAPVAAAFTLMGDVHAAQGKCAEAVKAYEQALKLDPKDELAIAGKAACAGK